MSRRIVTQIAVPGRPALQLVELDGMLFSSSVHGADPKTGALSDDPGRQFDLAFANLDALLSQAGHRPGELGLVTVCIPADSHRAHINKPWLAMYPDEGSRPARKTNEYPLPAGVQVQLQVMGVAGQQPKPIALRGFEHRDPIPPAVRIGDMLFTSVVGAQHPATGQSGGDADAQIKQAFLNLEALIEAGGGTWDDALHVTGWLADRVNDVPRLFRHWLDIFPPTEADRQLDLRSQHPINCPVRKTMQYDLLKERGSVLQLQGIAVMGGRPRENFQIPQVAIHVAGTMGASKGRLACSSGIWGDPPNQPNSLGDLDEQAGWVFRYIQTLVEKAGGTSDSIGQITILVRDYTYESDIIERHWRKMFPDPDDEPARHFVGFGLTKNRPELLQLHMVAVV